MKPRGEDRALIYTEDGNVRPLRWATAESLKVFGFSKEQMRSMARNAMRNDRSFVDVPDCPLAGHVGAWKEDHALRSTGVYRIPVGVLNVEF